MAKSHWNSKCLFGGDLNDLERRELGLAIISDLMDEIDEAIKQTMSQAEANIQSYDNGQDTFETIDDELSKFQQLNQALFKRHKAEKKRQMAERHDMDAAYNLWNNGSKAAWKECKLEDRHERSPTTPI